MFQQAAAGYMASCVSRGRLALFSDNKTKVGGGSGVNALQLADARPAAGSLQILECTMGRPVCAVHANDSRESLALAHWHRRAGKRHSGVATEGVG